MGEYPKLNIQKPSNHQIYQTSFSTFQMFPLWFPCSYMISSDSEKKRAFHCLSKPKVFDLQGTKKPPTDPQFLDKNVVLLSFIHSSNFRGIKKI